LGFEVSLEDVITTMGLPAPLPNPSPSPQGASVSTVGGKAPPGSASAATRGAAVEVRRLSKSFEHGGRRLDIIRHIDTTIAPGEMVAIVGASGAGKSTLLHCLGTLDLPTSGSLLIDGVDITRLSPSALADFRNRTIGFVFQFHHLLPEFTALENVAMPALIQRVPRAQALGQARAILERVGLAERLTHKPGELSGGEQQRVALARALVLRPALLLADEPTGNLDHRTGESIHELFFALNRERGTTMIIVTHNPELAARMPRRLQMVDGQLVDGASL
jgi:lipoprotein-releasing system ATP-binding protein